MKVLFVVTQVEHALKMNPFIYSQGESLKKLGVEVKYLFLSGKGPVKYIKGIFDVNQEVNRNAYDIIHGHYNYNSWVASFQNKVPVVASFLGCDILKSRRGISKIFNNYINNRVKKKAVFFIYKTNQMAERNPMNPLMVIPNGVNLNIFKPVDKIEARQKLGLDAQKKYVLFASDPSREEKNFALAKNAFKYINDKNVELLVVKNATQEQLNMYYNVADLLIVTSLREGSINTVKEALACNLPIVSVDVGDVREHSTSVENILVSTRDAQQFANDIMKMLQKNIKTDSRSFISEHLSVDGIAAKILQAYKRALNQKE